MKIFVHFSYTERVIIKIIVLLCIINIGMIGIAFRVHFHPILEALATSAETTSGEKIDVGTTTIHFVQELQKINFDPHIVKQLTRNQFSVPGVLITLHDDNIQIFEYSDSTQALQDMDSLTEYYSAKNLGKDSWKHKVHIYNKESVILFYMGSNENMLAVIRSLL